MKFYFTRVGFATDNSTVSSLRSVDERLVITCDGTTTPATTTPVGGSAVCWRPPNRVARTVTAASRGRHSLDGG